MGKHGSMSGKMSAECEYFSRASAASAFFTHTHTYPNNTERIYSKNRMYLFDESRRLCCAENSLKKHKFHQISGESSTPAHII